jgi:hypothetical protein
MGHSGCGCTGRMTLVCAQLSRFCDQAVVFTAAAALLMYAAAGGLAQ